MNFAAIGEEALELREAATADAEVTDLKPGEAVTVSSPYFRRHLRLVAYAGEARRVTIGGNHRRIGLSRASNKPIVVSDMSGKEIASIPLGDFGFCDLSFNAPTAGFYVLQLDLGGNAFAVDRTDVPLAADCSPWIYKKHPCPQGMIGSGGRLFMAVKAGRRAEFRIGGSRMNEKVSVAIASPDGRVVFENPALHRWAHYLSSAVESDGVWEMRFDAPTNGDFDDFSVMLAGVRPFLFFSQKKFWYSR
jgi:hypothetical protein